MLQIDLNSIEWAGRVYRVSLPNLWAPPTIVTIGWKALGILCQNPCTENLRKISAILQFVKIGIFMKCFFFLNIIVLQENDA